MDVLFAIHDCAPGISPVTSYSGVTIQHSFFAVGCHCDCMGRSRAVVLQLVATAEKSPGHRAIVYAELVVAIKIGPDQTLISWF